MPGVLVQLLLVWFVGIPVLVVLFMLTYPRYVRWRVAAARRSRGVAGPPLP